MAASALSAEAGVVAEVGGRKLLTLTQTPSKSGIDLPKCDNYQPNFSAKSLDTNQTGNRKGNTSQMTDNLSPERRSWNMSRIRGKSTSAEMAVRKALHKAGFRFRLHRKDLPGKPDIVQPKYKTVIFVHGCFWHSHGCKDSRIPKTNTEFWTAKLIDNAKRDYKNQRLLAELGWAVKIVWECEIMKLNPLEILLENN